jgi:hypothetical protein
MKRTILLAAVLTLCVGSARASTDVQPVAKCSITSARVSSGLAAASGICKRGGRRVAVTWSHTITIHDATGSLCGLTPSHGSSRSFRFVPPDARQIAVAFQVRPRTGKGKAAVRTVRQTNAGSTSICSYQPKITNVSATQPSACTWATTPVFDGHVFRVGDIQCAGDGTCTWQLDQPSPSQQKGFTFYGLGSFKCGNGYYGGVSLQLNLGLGPDANGQGGWSCFTTFRYATSWAAPNIWGGYGAWTVQLVTSTGGSGADNKVIGFESPQPDAWSGWHALPGNVNPCTLPGMTPTG